MQVIYCNINIFDYDQQVYLVEGEKSRLIAKIPFISFGKSIPGLCDHQKVYKVHLFCNVPGMAEQAADAITEEEIRVYGKSKIDVEVN